MFRIVAFAVLAALVVAPPALAAQARATAPATIERSGVITTIDPARHVVTFEEMGPWRPPHQGLVTRSVTLTPATRLEIVERSKVGDQGWLGGFTTSSMTAATLHRGDFVTVTLAREGHGMKAIQVAVVRPTSDQTAAARRG